MTTATDTMRAALAEAAEHHPRQAITYRRVPSGAYRVFCWGHEAGRVWRAPEAGGWLAWAYRADSPVLFGATRADAARSLLLARRAAGWGA